MSDFMAVIRDQLGMPKRRSTFIPVEGVNGLIPADELPQGWVAVQEFDADWNPSYECSGEVIDENASFLIVSVSGKHIFIVKKWATITRSTR